MGRKSVEQKIPLVVVIGGGFGGVYAIHELQRILGKNVRVILIDPRHRFTFTPLLHEVAGGVLSSNAVTIAYGDLFRYPIRHLTQRALHIDLKKKSVQVERSKIRYDYLVLSPGAVTVDHSQAPDALELKTTDDAIEIRASIEQLVTKSSRDRRLSPLRFVVVGAGATGIELAGEMTGFVKFRSKLDGLRTPAEIVVIHSRSTILGNVDSAMRAVVENRLKRLGIRLILDARVVEAKNGSVTISVKGKKTQTLSSDMTVWTAGVRPVEISAEGFSRRDKHTPVLSTLQIEGQTHAFAIGDAALLLENPAPDLAQVAVAQGTWAGKNIVRLLRGRPPLPFTFKNKGFLVSLGQRYAVGRVFGVLIKGFFAWFLWRTIYLVKFLGTRSKSRMAKEYTRHLFLPWDTCCLKKKNIKRTKR